MTSDLFQRRRQDSCTQATASVKRSVVGGDRALTDVPEVVVLCKVVGVEYSTVVMVMNTHAVLYRVVNDVVNSFRSELQNRGKKF